MGIGIFWQLHLCYVRYVYRVNNGNLPFEYLLAEISLSDPFLVDLRAQVCVEAAEKNGNLCKVCDEDVHCISHT